MKIDTYTKGVLTVIAFSLVTLCFQNSIRDAEASSRVQQVAICSLYELDRSCVKVEAGALKVRPYKSVD